MRSTYPEPALVSSYAQSTFTVRMGSVAYVDAISPLLRVWVVFVHWFGSQAQLWADGGRSGA